MAPRERPPCASFRWKKPALTYPTHISELFTLTTCEAAPLTAYLRTTEDSNLIPNHDVEVNDERKRLPGGEYHVQYESTGLAQLYDRSPRRESNRSTFLDILTIRSSTSSQATCLRTSPMH